MIPRYSTPEMTELWSEQSKFAAWLEVELAACEAWHELGQIPLEELETIRERAAFTVERIEEIEKTVHHDVIAFTTCLAEHIGPASRFVHMGLTSNDVVDTAQALRLKRAGELILAEVEGLLATLRRLALEHKNRVVIGRTHGVHAEPITLGLKFLLYYAEMQRNAERLRSAFEQVAVGKISGAVGTYAHTGPELEAIVCRRLGIASAPVATQVIQRDRHAQLVCALAICASTLEKIATEIRHLQRTEVRELEEPFRAGQKGSSAMPHKRNPVKCEQLTGLARLLRGYVVTALENNALWHERDISHSSTERVILPDATTLLHYMLRQIRGVLEGLHYYPENMQRNLELTRGLIYSQRALLALVEHGLSREEAYEIVQRAAMETWADSNVTFQERLRAEPRVRAALSDEKLAAIFDPTAFLRHVDHIFERVLGSSN
ncbi:MAG: adenylosuccinate lyase [Candidatus Hydrogenedentota bacterium]|uniref:Adenylosuccinate lyase n=1 Tax=Sumerlaea chitinivorans TaxID=2250252 RepID=A0A2Z4Y3C5_SUMC1|nr:Adenylosuccinate lyase [Candidatus Sumerlaea chitinivorans]RMH28781.1 MAG: adenylosuccinate lyase [Candidatus Hydrogenedentota bacterium]GIX44430.1 MAG: adenylosuccinate lyase [Candidatus Sumerlaea sp.]